METQFNNVTVTIEANTPMEAYAILCNLFAPGCKKGILEYTTDTYISSENVNSEKSTAELFPEE